MRIVVTGTGIVSSIGCDNEIFWNNLLEGKSGFSPISCFDTDDYNSKLAGQIPPDELQLILGGIRMNHYDAIQIMTSSAAKLAYENSGLQDGFYSSEELGIILGSTYGYVDSVSKFYLEALRDGPAYVSPIHFTNTVMNAAAGKISILFKITGLCSTIATGETSGLDALIYAYDILQAGKCKAVLVGGGEILNEGIYLGFYQNEKLAGSEGRDEYCRPFDAKANGIILSEGSGIIVLETLDNAKKRGANILAEITGFDRHFQPNMQDEKCQINSIAGMMNNTINNAGLTKNDISLIMANACSDPAKDRMEALAIKELFDSKTDEVCITAPKSMIGECLEGSGPMISIAGIFSILHNQIPPIINLVNPLVKGLNYIREPFKEIVNNVMVNALSDTGQKVSVIFSQYSK